MQVFKPETRRAKNIGTLWPFISSKYGLRTKVHRS